MLDPRELERQVDEARNEIQRVQGLSDDEMPAGDRRDRIMNLTGQIAALEPQARELREAELAEARRVAGVGQPVDGDSAGAHAEQLAAYRAFVQSGDIRAAALETATDANGGYLMPVPVREAMIDTIRTVNPIMADATVFQLSNPGTFKIELPRKTGVTNGGWTTEKAARDKTNAPTFGMQELECFEWYAYPEATQSSLDAIEGAEQLIIDDIQQTAEETWGTAFATGTGSGQPTGVWSTAGIAHYDAQVSASSNALDAAQFLKAFFKLPPKFLATAKWYGTGATIAALSALAWPNMADTPLVRFDQAGNPTIMGKPFVICDSAPAIGDGAYPVAFGDMRRGYAVGIHTRISTLRDALTNKPYVGFYTTGRTGGVPWDPKAVLLLKSDAS